MTKANRKSLVDFIRMKTESDIKSKDAARQVLISEGVYTKTGNFTKNFGGQNAKAKPAA